MPVRIPTADYAAQRSYGCRTSATYAVKIPSPGSVSAEATRVMGKFLRDVMKQNMRKIRISAFLARTKTTRTVGRTPWRSQIEHGSRRPIPYDDHLAPDGRIMEMLSEHQCQGWLEGYLLTGRHGFFSCYEAFIHIIDSMFNQHAKWLKVCNHIPWRFGLSLLLIICSPPTSGAKTTMASVIKIQGLSITSSTKKRRWFVSIYRPMRIACSRSPTTACEAEIMSTSWWQESSHLHNG